MSPKLNLKRLAHLVALAETRNFGRAAERCGLSQSAFSRSIQSAEEEIGLQLFDRGTLEVTPTDAGSFVVERARGLLTEEHWLERDIRLLGQRAMGDLSIGFGPYPAATLMSGLLAEIRRSYPQVRVQAEINDYESLIRHLRAEQLDFYFADMRDVPDVADLKLTPMARVFAGFYVRPGHPLLASGEPVELRDLLPYGIAAVHPRKAILLELGRRMGLPEGQPLELAAIGNDLHLLKQLALRTNTVMAAPETVVAAEAASGRLVLLKLLDMGPIPIDLSLVTLVGRNPSPIAQFAADTLAQLILEQNLQI